MGAGEGTGARAASVPCITDKEMEEKKDIKAVTVEDVKAELEKTLKRMADAREGKLEG